MRQSVQHEIDLSLNQIALQHDYGVYFVTDKIRVINSDYCRILKFLTMLQNTQNHWIFGLCTSSAILNNHKT